MGRLSANNARRVDATAAILRTVDDDAPKALPAVVLLLAEALDGAHVACSVRREEEALVLVDAHVTPRADDCLRDFDRILRATTVNFFTYNGSCSEPPLRKTITVVEAAEVRRRAGAPRTLAELETSTVELHFTSLLDRAQCNRSAPAARLWLS